MSWYILVDRRPVRLDGNGDTFDDYLRWRSAAGGAWIVGKSTIGEAEVSTVFLGIDHRFGGNGPPILFETMVFGGPLDGTQARYTSWAEAERGHAAACLAVRGAALAQPSTPRNSDAE